jgi:hypothetical protein
MQQNGNYGDRSPDLDRASRGRPSNAGNGMQKKNQREKDLERELEREREIKLQYEAELKKNKCLGERAQKDKYFEDRLNVMQFQLLEMQKQQSSMFEVLQKIMSQNDKLIQNDEKRMTDFSLRASTKTNTIATNTTNDPNFILNNNSGSNMLYRDHTSGSLTISEEQNHQRAGKKNFGTDMVGSGIDSCISVDKKFNFIEYNNSDINSYCSDKPPRRLNENTSELARETYGSSSNQPKEIAEVIPQNFVCNNPTRGNPKVAEKNFEQNFEANASNDKNCGKSRIN